MIVIASTFNGKFLRDSIYDYLILKNIMQIENLGEYENEIISTHAVCRKVLKDSKNRGIIVGNSLGMAIAANRFPHIRAVECNSIDEIIECRESIDCNVLCLNYSKITNINLNETIDRWLKQNFDETTYNKSSVYLMDQLHIPL